jgi:hypothetical protein
MPNRSLSENRGVLLLSRGSVCDHLGGRCMGAYWPEMDKVSENEKSISASESIACKIRRMRWSLGIEWYASSRLLRRVCLVQVEPSFVIALSTARHLRTSASEGTSASVLPYAADLNSSSSAIEMTSHKPLQMAVISMKRQIIRGATIDFGISKN